MQEAEIGDVFESAANPGSQLTSGLPKTSRIRYPQLYLRRRCRLQLDLSHSYRLRAFDISSPSIMMVERTSSSRLLSSPNRGLVLAHSSLNQATLNLGSTSALSADAQHPSSTSSVSLQPPSIIPQHRHYADFRSRPFRSLPDISSSAVRYVARRSPRPTVMPATLVHRHRRKRDQVHLSIASTTTRMQDRTGPSISHRNRCNNLQRGLRLAKHSLVQHPRTRQHKHHTLRL